MLGFGTGTLLGCGTGALLGFGTGAWLGFGTGAWLGFGTGAWLGFGTGASFGFGTGSSLGFGTGSSLGLDTGAWLGLGKGFLDTVGFEVLVFVGAAVEGGGVEGGKMKEASLVGSTAVMVVDVTLRDGNSVALILVGFEDTYFNAVGSTDVGRLEGENVSNGDIVGTCVTADNDGTDDGFFDRSDSIDNNGEDVTTLDDAEGNKVGIAGFLVKSFLVGVCDGRFEMLGPADRVGWNVESVSDKGEKVSVFELGGIVAVTCVGICNGVVERDTLVDIDGVNVGIPLIGGVNKRVGSGAIAHTVGMLVRLGVLVTSIGNSGERESRRTGVGVIGAFGALGHTTPNDGWELFGIFEPTEGVSVGVSLTVGSDVVVRFNEELVRFGPCEFIVPLTIIGLAEAMKCTVGLVDGVSTSVGKGWPVRAGLETLVGLLLENGPVVVVEFGSIVLLGCLVSDGRDSTLPFGFRVKGELGNITSFIAG